MPSAFEVVALVGAPTIVAVYSWAQRRWEFQRSDLAEARSIVDSAALCICRERDAVHRLLWEWRSGSDSASKNAAVDHANSIRIESRALFTGLVVRLGRQSTITCRYQDVLDEVELFGNFMVQAFEANEPFDPRAEEKVLNFLHEHVRSFEEAAFAFVKLDLRHQPASKPVVAEFIRDHSGEDESPTDD